jgi:hypothetical protein
MVQSGNELRGAVIAPALRNNGGFAAVYSCVQNTACLDASGNRTSMMEGTNLRSG